MDFADDKPAVALPDNIEQLVSMYVKLRDRKDDLERAHKDKLAAINAGMEKLEAIFMTHMKQQGLTSLPTNAGVPYQNRVTSVTIADKLAFKNWLMEDQERIDAFLDFKANKPAVVAFRDAHDDLPPGLNYREEIVVRVRKS